MKMLGFLTSELSNSAKYYYTIGDISKTNCNDLHKYFGTDWKSFIYEKKVK